jgi:hypothetical protein
MPGRPIKSIGMSEHHGHHQRKSKFGPVLRANLVEITAALVAALGLFLLLERMSIRSTLFHWASTGSQNALHVLGRMGDALARSIARLTLSNAIGLVLVIMAVVALILRIRWRLVRSASQTVLRCPRCGGGVHRVHRRWGDRIVSLFVPVRRYRCSNRECRWCGVHVAASRNVPEPTVSVE